MDRIQFIHQPRENPVTGAFAIAASCTLHALTLGSLLGLAFYYQSHAQPPASGSAAGAPTITLEAMVVAPSRPNPPPALLAALTPPTIPMEYPPTVIKQLQCPVTPVKLPDDGVPVLPLRMSKSTLAKTETPHHTTSSPTITPSSAKPAAAAKPSSYAPGELAFPHPPYPEEARSRGQTGTVTVKFTFDAQGNLAQVEVLQSSGVRVLDSGARLFFMHAHLHYPQFAGQSLSQPVQFSLEKQ